MTGEDRKWMHRSNWQEREPENRKTCTMCGDFCAMKKGMGVFSKDIKRDKMAVG